MGGAKNHGVVLPDADLDQAVDAIVGAAFGSAGERCMALSVVVAVGEDTAVCAAAASAERNPASAARPARRRIRPQITVRWSLRRPTGGALRNYIAMGVAEGAELVVDGRGLTVPGREHQGFFLGPSLFDHVRTGMRSYRRRDFPDRFCRC